ncbi:MAG TPA: hypothetical protein VGE98_01210 [Thermoanaerobaculia bacterium]
MSAFGLYLVGFTLIVIGLALGAHLAGVPAPWIAAGVIVLIGLGILRAVTRPKYPPDGGPPR